MKAALMLEAVSRELRMMIESQVGGGCFATAEIRNLVFQGR